MNSKIITNLKLGLDEDLEKKLLQLYPQMSDFRVLKKSVDARTRHQPHFNFSVEFTENGEKIKPQYTELEKVKNSDATRPVIVGSGPAGLFAALRLVERNIPCILIERGSASEQRIKGINRFWRYGELDPQNNVCFGEGGAGLYSDGKLVTRIKSPHIPYVLQKLVQFGAPEEILYLSNPHVGSDKLRRVIPFLRNYLLAHGCEIHFDTQVVDLEVKQENGSNQIKGVRALHSPTDLGVRELYFETSQVILATGHSAEDVFQLLQRHQVFLEGKSFALGVRIEHPQEQINKIQFREAWNSEKLGAANYKLTYNDPDQDIGVYSFCMCPGGYVLSSGTEADGIVTNGMSNFRRNSPFANSAIVVTINHERQFGSDLMGGLKFRRNLEQNFFRAARENGATKELPAENLVSFLEGSMAQPPVRKGSSPSGSVAVAIHSLLPPHLVQGMRSAIENFDSKMKGFISSESQIYAVESRTSCPVRVTRHPESLQSLSHVGLYPCGEGAGYAGGITSAACDGIRVADQIYATLSDGARTKV